MRKSNGVPTIRITSALLNAYRRVRWKWCGSPGGSVPRAAPFMYAGMLSVRTKSIAASDPRVVQTWLPSSTHGRSAPSRISVRRSTSLGAPMLLVEKRYLPASGITASLSGTCASRMSRPISRYAGPGAPASASRKAIEHMSATRSVVTTLEADFDDLDARVDAAVVNVDDVAAAERVDDVDSLGLQGLRHQMTARDPLGLGLASDLGFYFCRGAGGGRHRVPFQSLSS